MPIRNTTERWGWVSLSIHWLTVLMVFSLVAVVGWVNAERPDWSPRRILDIGCTIGHNAVPIAQAFPDAEVIAIGDELTSGQRLDTNSRWISGELALLGIPVVFHTTACDTIAAGVEAFRAAVGRADVVIATAPTVPRDDDLPFGPAMTQY